MAGKKDIVEQALKLIAGGAKEAGPSIAERAAKNIDVFNTANRLGVDTNDIAKLQETKRLMDYHKGFMGDVKERAKSANEIVQQMKASGAFPMEIGTRYTTEHSRRTGQGPWTVTNYYVDPKNPQGSYGYYVRRELPDGGYEESISKIRDPKLEAMHGPEKWEELQRGFIPMTGPKVVKASGGSIREGYGPGGWVDDVVKMAGKVISGEGEEAAKAGIRAYQGSPHNFAAERLVRFPEGRTEYIVGQPDVLPDVPEGAEVLQNFPLGRMRMDKIGTGEGAQAYGHGLYAAESEPTAKYYRDALSRDVSYGGQPVAKSHPMDNPEAGAIHSVASRVAEGMAPEEAIAEQAAIWKNYAEQMASFSKGKPELEKLLPERTKSFYEIANTIEQLDPALFKKNPGHMYEVNIAANPEQFLDWDKPLSEQSEAVKNAFRSMDIADESVWPNITANDAYEMLRVDSMGDDAFLRDQAYRLARRAEAGAGASRMLREAGIPGIKYLDAGSRGAGDGTRNYVVFDDKLISIIRKYGIAGASAMLGYNLMENLSPEQARAATQADNDYQSSGTYTGGMLPPGMEPSGELTSRIPSASDRIYDYVMSKLGGDDATKPQRAETIMNLLDQTPLGFAPVAYDVGRSVAETVSRADGGYVDDDIHDALRIAKDIGGSTSPAVMMEDAKGNKYDAQGNIIPPTNPGPNPARSDVTPQSVAAQAVNDPATYDALMERYAVPDRDIAEYEALKAAVSQQPQDIQQMTHVGDRPRREMTIDMPLFGGEYSMGTAPYDVAQGLQGAAQTAYDFKTMPAYFFPATAPFALGADVLESRLADDPLGFALNAALTPQGASAAKSALGAIRRNPKTTAAAIGAGAYLSPDEAEAGPERWFSKAMEVARDLPMEKMTGQQALAMLRKAVSPEELKWTGADVFLPQQKQITKQDLVDYLAKNRVQTQDVVFGGSKPTRREDVRPSETARAPFMEDWNILKEKRKALDEEYYSLPPEEQASRQSEFWSRQYQLDTARDTLKSKMVDATIEEMGGLGEPLRYGPGSAYGEKYVTPGGADYRETLITLPEDLPSKERKLAELDAEATRLELAGDPRWRDVSRERGELLRSQGRSVYSSGHWEGVPNVAGHIRTQILDVTPPGANRPYKAFNVDEAQSDWAKAGRERGFKDQNAMAAVARLRQQTQELQKKLKDEGIKLHNEHTERIAPYVEGRIRYENELRDKYRRGEISLGDMNRLAEAYNVGPDAEYLGQYRAKSYEILKPIQDQIAKNEAEIARIGKNIGDTPIAPYIGSTQNWTDLAIKKSIDQALDAGSDYFTFTPGEAQAARYDLSKHISKVQYNPDDGSLLAYDPKGKMVVNESVNDPDDLDEYLGKELADKMRLEAESRRSAVNEYDIEKDEDTGEWYVSLYGEPIGETFPSKGHAKDYLNEMMANEFASSPAELSGLDLKVGGEGMIDYYNNIFKKRVEKVVKDATGKKVQWEVIPVQTADGPREQLGFRLTDDMKEARFSDFNKGGRVADPVVNKALSLTSGY